MIATKVEKISLDGIWLNPKYYIIGNQQESLEQRNPQRLSLVRGVHNKSIMVVEVVSPKRYVSTAWIRYSLCLHENARSS